jgi:hypothetical protein
MRGKSFPRTAGAWVRRVLVLCAMPIVAACAQPKPARTPLSTAIDHRDDRVRPSSSRAPGSAEEEAPPSSPDNGNPGDDDDDGDDPEPGPGD